MYVGKSVKSRFEHSTSQQKDSNHTKNVSKNKIQINILHAIDSYFV